MANLNILILWTFQSTYIESVVKSLVQDSNHVTVIYSENLKAYPRLNDVLDLETRYFLEDTEIPLEIVAKNWSAIFVAGWHKKYFRKCLLQRSDIPRILYTDTQYVNNLRYFILSLLFRCMRRFYFNGAYVPGARQIKFLQSIGFSNQVISTGGVAYDDSTFYGSELTSNNRSGAFLYVGRIAREKNIQNLCQAYNLYRQASINPRDFEMIGSIGNYFPQSQPGLQLIGYKNKAEIAAALVSCRAFLFPSINEPFGVALLEAAACGAPLMASLNVGAGDHLITGNNGFIVDTKNVDEISRKMLEFDEWNQQTLQSASKTSQALASFFSPRNWVIRFEELYTKILNQKQAKSSNPKSICFYVAVIPKYRIEALELLQARIETQLVLCACTGSSDSLVNTDTTNKKIQTLRMVKFSNYFFLQTGRWLKALRSDCLILDLNPRSLTAWIFLLLRLAIPKKRTLVWGHLYSRFERSIVTIRLRTFMRYISDGAVLYTYSDFIKAKKVLPKSAIFVAPNSIYSRAVQERTDSEKRDSVIYCGRLVADKKVDLLLKAYKESGLNKNGISMIIIGDGPEFINLIELATELNIIDSVLFLGEVYDVSTIKENYAKAIVSVSPGYVGLSLTQSAGFGVPMILARNDNHSPEVELIRSIKHYFFESNDHLSLSNMLRYVNSQAGTPEFELSCEDMVEHARRTYSTELMAEGLHAAIYDMPQFLGVEGFPNEI